MSHKDDDQVHDEIYRSMWDALEKLDDGTFEPLFEKFKGHEACVEHAIMTTLGSRAAFGATLLGMTKVEFLLHMEEEYDAVQDADDETPETPPVPPKPMLN